MQAGRGLAGDGLVPIIGSRGNCGVRIFVCCRRFGHRCICAHCVPLVQVASCTHSQCKKNSHHGHGYDESHCQPRELFAGCSLLLGRINASLLLTQHYSRNWLSTLFFQLCVRYSVVTGVGQLSCLHIIKMAIVSCPVLPRAASKKSTECHNTLMHRVQCGLKFVNYLARIDDPLVAPGWKQGKLWLLLQRLA